MKRAFASLCAVAVVTGAVAAGCGHGSDAGGRTAAAARQARPEPLTWQQELRVSDAEQRLVRQCMNRHGFRYWEDRTLTLRESMPVRYVQDDVAWAREYGYGSRLLAEQDRARRANPNLAYRKSLSDGRRAAYDTALDGGTSARVLQVRMPGGGTVRKHVGGCAAEAEQRLYGDAATWFRADATASNLQPLYVSRMLKDRRLTRAVTAWAGCMRRAGRPFGTPDEARAAATPKDGLSRAEEAEAFAAERRIAVADAGCARDAGLKDLGRKLESEYIDKLGDTYGDELNTYRRLRNQALDRAVRIVPQRA
ncbi:hypothetical protein ABZX30_01055 [Streptomyces sp. NPDC004542]|uniref:hypothetical protein n=1 Tax=Streptomyces sp. NPDC004542 TaxID=3154281 RepID=UPI0033AC23CE